MKLNTDIYSVNVTGKRYVIHQGGTRSGKTYSILQFILVYTMTHSGKRVSVVGQSVPALKRGVVTDIRAIIDAEGWNMFFTELKTEGLFKCRLNSSYIEYFPASSHEKLRGPKRDILFINECNTISWEAFRQLDVRTTLFTFLDFNPVNYFWVHKKLIPLINDSEYVLSKSTYRQNRFLGSTEVANIERQRVNEAWWRVFGEGETGNPEGKVFTNWEVVDYSPVPATKGQVSVSATYLPGKLLGYGLDPGYSHSPTAIVQVNEHNGELWVKEHFYKTSTHTDELFTIIKDRIDLRAPAYADPSAPQTIDFLCRKGWAGLSAAHTGPDSVIFGLNVLMERKIKITKDSIHLVREMHEYEWRKNRDGEYTAVPLKVNDHAIDAMRYVVSTPTKKRLLFT